VACHKVRSSSLCFLKYKAEMKQSLLFIFIIT
ncbi:MAG: hypothetical protein ACI90V_003846, partial [Bacillariaceae sp.]